MNWYDIIFYAFAILTIVSAVGVVFSRSIVYAAFSLLFTFFGVAALYVLLAADFLAITQILLYVGGILVLVVFGIMLTSRANRREVKKGLVSVAPSVAAMPPAAFVWFVETTIVKSPVAPAASVSGPVIVTCGAVPPEWPLLPLRPSCLPV